VGVPDVLAAVEAQLRDGLGADTARGGISFVGVDRIDVLRFTGAAPGAVRYVTLGMSRHPMADPAASIADPLAGPRVELLLELSAARDDVLRALAALAASPAVEGLVVGRGALLELGAPLWSDAPFAGVLVDNPSPLVPPVSLGGGRDPVRVLPVVPVLAAEAAYKRVYGAEALREQWARAATDLADPDRRPVPLDPPSGQRA